MARKRYVVAYDIRDPVRLRRVHETVKGYGFGLQYSVFICDLDEIEKLGLRTDLGEILSFAADSVVLVDVGEPTGRGTSSFEFMGRHPRLPTTGATIV